MTKKKKKIKNDTYMTYLIKYLCGMTFIQLKLCKNFKQVFFFFLTQIASNVVFQ